MSPHAAQQLADSIRRTPIEHHVLWTGDRLHGLPRSRMGRTLSCVHEIGAPVSLRTLVQRVAASELGVSPEQVRNAVRQHQAAQPAVLLLLARRPGGDYVAVTDIPWAGAGRRTYRAGEVVLAAGEGRGRREAANDLAPAARLTASA